MIGWGNPHLRAPQRHPCECHRQHGADARHASTRISHEGCLLVSGAEGGGCCRRNACLRPRGRLCTVRQQLVLLPQQNAHRVALKYIVVDEFQDFSLMFYELLRAAMGHASDAQLMTVGDDWQAINEFARSTTDYFRDFEQLFAPAQTLRLETNRRSARSIVDLGNSVMRGFGFPARSYSPLT
ncbi:UvrD-helicase domain-containing protein [Gordonia aichiensis]|uniref:UvrD-helicase domain-containing protein n=1 Tax=Gordonia aichiensis TaxID=36820 RepID=UPI0026D784CB